MGEIAIGGSEPQVHLRFVYVSVNLCPSAAIAAEAVRKNEVVFA
jgi:hypothetical protein